MFMQKVKKLCITKNKINENKDLIKETEEKIKKTLKSD